MQYSVAQFIVQPKPERRRNFGILLEDEHHLYMRFDLSLPVGRRLLGPTTFSNLGRSIGETHAAEDWKRRGSSSFLDWLHYEHRYYLRFSVPEPIYGDPAASLDRLFRGRAVREPEREKKGIVSNKSLSRLFLLHLVAELREVQWKTSLQKLVYLAEAHQENLGASGLKFKFFRYSYGPFSKEIYAGLNRLAKMNLVEYTERPFRVSVTDRGRSFLEQTAGILREHPTGLESITMVLEKYGHASYRRAMRAAYETGFVRLADLGDDLLPLDLSERIGWTPTREPPKVAALVEELARADS